MSRSDAVGITTTLPIEAIIAAGRTPIDLNNLFVTSPNPAARVEYAEQHGFPRTICSWIKGIYGTIVEEGIGTVVGVTQGDCSLTHALLEVLQTEDVEVIGFEYPHGRDRAKLDAEISRFESTMGADRDGTERVRESLKSVRADLAAIDALMADGLPAGMSVKAHLAILSGSDLNGFGTEGFADQTQDTLTEIRNSLTSGKPSGFVRLALAGVPPIVDDLFDHVERLNARIVLSEMAREFAMIRTGASSVVDQYHSYAYPYDVFYRLQELGRLAREREVDGVIHYVQSFCYRGVQDRIMRERLDVPVLTLEGDRPGHLEGSAVTRLEAFVEMLADRRA